MAESMWSVLYRDISIRSWSIFFIRLIITADLNVKHRVEHEIFIRNAKKIRDKLCYLDVLQIIMRLLIGRIKYIAETEFHISLFLVSISRVSRLISKLYTVRHVHYLRAAYRRFYLIAIRISFLRTRKLFEM
jgi:hypothetical protein